MRRAVSVCAMVFLFACAVAAQKSKPWTEWSEKEAEKILNDSAWGQTQTESSGGDSEASSTSTITQTTAARREDQNISAATKAESGERKEATAIHYRVRWLSAKPIREAFVRMVEIQSQGADPEKLAQLRTFVDRDFGDYIVLTLTLDGNDRKRMGPAMREITNADESALQKSIYLERKDGKRVFLSNYRAPVQDGLGAKFVFPRKLEGKPFIEVGSGEVRVFVELGKTIKLNRRFKVAEMMYDGKLEF